jgi:hypothetical protein
MNIHTTYIFSTSGGVGPLTDGTYTKLAVLIAEKRNHSYSTTIRWIRCRLTFALIRSYTRLAVLIAEKRNHSYSTTIRWIRFHLIFALIRPPYSATENIDLGKDAQTGVIMQQT